MNINLTRVTTLALGAALAGALLAGTAASAADQNRWPGTKAGAPTPKVKGVPPELAKNLANFRIQVEPDQMVEQQAQAGNLVPIGGQRQPSQTPGIEPNPGQRLQGMPNQRRAQ